MGDLEDRFRALDRVRPPDLWPDIENRHPGPRWQRLSPRRLLAGSVAFAVAATGIGFAAWVFSPSSLPGIVGFHPAPKGNGKIAFVAGERLFEFTGGSPSIYVMNSDGSGVQSIRKVYLASSLSWSPDGTKLAFANTNGEFDPESISVMNGDGSEIRQITPDSRSVQAVEPAWSPDGKQIAFAESAWFVNPSPSVTRTLGIYIMRPDGTGIRQLTSCGREVCKGDSSPTWSPDGSHIAFVHRGAIYVMAADGSDLRPIASCPKLGCLAAVLPEWSPDGKKILFMWEKDRRTQLETVTPDGSEITAIFDCGSTCADLSGVTWSPDGRKIAMTFSRRLSTRSDFYVMNADGTGLKRVTQFPLQVCCPAWQPVPLPSPLQSGLPPTGSPPMPPASPPTLVSGEIAFVRRSASTEDQGIFLIINDGPPGKLIDGYEPAFSPDGSMVVFRQSHGEGETEIDVVDTDGTGFRTLTKIAGNPLELAPAWSPDGKRLAYASIGGLYVMNADGSSQHKIIGSSGSFVVWTEPSWSPDGSKLLYVAVSDSDNLTAIHVIGADGSDDVVLKGTPLMDYRTPSWSPDGTRILFAAAPDSALPGPALFDLYVMNADGSGVRRLTHTADVSESEPAWSPDGTQIVFGRDAGRGHIDIYVMNAEGSELRALTQDSMDDLSPTWGRFLPRAERAVRLAPARTAAGAP